MAHILSPFPDRQLSRILVLLAFIGQSVAFTGYVPPALSRRPHAEQTELPVPRRAMAQPFDGRQENTCVLPPVHNAALLSARTRILLLTRSYSRLSRVQVVRLQCQYLATRQTCPDRPLKSGPHASNEEDLPRS
ncbi:MAG: hypothetical protein EP344_06500 [Bacteroidetes bacterium]|nr:MAG: hypothetical protein EP344_06500 [Bacteroidota bacterium]